MRFCLKQPAEAAFGGTSHFLIGVALPVALYDLSFTGLSIIATGVLLTFVFVALAFLGAVCTRDKARGIGVALLLWFFFALIFDGIVLFILFTFQDYPLEKATIAMVALNPIDLARTIVLLQMDVSALMGLTGCISARQARRMPPAASRRYCCATQACPSDKPPSLGGKRRASIKCRPLALRLARKPRARTEFSKQLPDPMMVPPAGE